VNNETDGLTDIAAQLCLRVAGMSRLADAAAKDLLEAFADVHGIDPAQYHWWEGLKEARCLTYGSLVDEWYTHVSELLRKMGGGVFLVVTDDEPFPWPVLKIDDSTPIPDVLGGMQFFEYFVFSSDFFSFFFDTHENELISMP